MVVHELSFFFILFLSSTPLPHPEDTFCLSVSFPSLLLDLNVLVFYSYVKCFYFFIKHTFVKFLLSSILRFLVIFGDRIGHECDTNTDYTSPFTRSYLDCV